MGDKEVPKYTNNVLLPKKPRGATHLLFTTALCGRIQKAVVSIKDADTLCGVKGYVRYVQRRGAKLVKKFDPIYTWNGQGIEELKDLNAEKKEIQKNRKKEKKD
jgi:hypothetical protein